MRAGRANFVCCRPVFVVYCETYGTNAPPARTPARRIGRVFTHGSVGEIRRYSGSVRTQSALGRSSAGTFLYSGQALEKPAIQLSLGTPDTTSGRRPGRQHGRQRRFSIQPGNSRSASHRDKKRKKALPSAPLQAAKI